MCISKIYLEFAGRVDMWRFRGFVRVSSSFKRTWWLGTKCVEPLRRTVLFHTTGAMAAKIQGTLSMYYIVGGVACGFTATTWFHDTIYCASITGGTVVEAKGDEMTRLGDSTLSVKTHMKQ